MRIISKFVDFYDSAQGMGIDKSLLYIRLPKKIKGLGCLTHRIHNYYGAGRVDSGIVFFCGKAYPFFILTGILKNEEKERRWICWSEADAAKAVFDLRGKKGLADYERKRGQRRYYWMDHVVCFDKEGIQRFFEENSKNFGYAEKLAAEHRAPVIICLDDRKYGTVLNGNLKKIKFYRMVDSYTAFQEIFMWLGAQAWPSNAIPDVTDKDMITAKGFDKHSFRRSSPRPDRARSRKKRKKSA